jgi:hypothetical protein
MTTPITDQAEVSIDFPDKFFMGTFSRGSRYDVSADKDGLHLHLERAEGEKRKVGFHVHYYLLAELLAASAEAVAGVDRLEPVHKQRLQEAARKWLEIA